MKYLYTVADPCYLVNILDKEKEDKVWKEFVNLMCEYCDEQQFNKKRIDECLKNASEYYSNNVPVKLLVLDKTDYGDWENFLSSKNNQIQVLSGYFTADTGNFAVAEIKKEVLNKLLNKKPEYKDLMAYFTSDLSPDEIGIEVDHEKYQNWAVIKIINKNTGELLAETEEL